MSYVKVNIGNINSGAAQGKDTNIIIFDFEEIDKSKWPSRDAGKVKMLGSIVMLPGKYVTTIYATSSSISLPRTSEGDEDAVGFSALPEFSHPGSPLEIEEFIANNTNRPLGVAVRVGGCDSDDPHYKIYGTPCNPLRLLVEGQDNNEAVKDMMKFEQSRKSNILPGRYYNTWTFATANAVPSDVTEVDVSSGSGEYQLTDNTSSTSITNLENAVKGGVYTLKGSGGTNPATIVTSSVNFLLTGVDWQGLSGSSLTVKAFDKGGSFVFIEQSRS